MDLELSGSATLVAFGDLVLHLPGLQFRGDKFVELLRGSCGLRNLDCSLRKLAGREEASCRFNPRHRAVTPAVRRIGVTRAALNVAPGTPALLARSDAVPLSGGAQGSRAPGANLSPCCTHATRVSSGWRHNRPHLSAGLGVRFSLVRPVVACAAGLAGCAQGSRAFCSSPCGCSLLACSRTLRSVGRLSPPPLRCLGRSSRNIGLGRSLFRCRLYSSVSIGRTRPRHQFPRLARTAMPLRSRH